MTGAMAMQGHSKEASFPLMLFASFMAHILALIVFIAAPQILPRSKRPTFGGSGPAGGLNVMTVDFRLGQPKEEPAPARYLKKYTQVEEPKVESKLEFPDEQKKKVKEQPAAKETLNVPAAKRKVEGQFGKGTDMSKDAGKSGKSGHGGIGLGSGEGGLGAGTGTGVPFPFPWYVEAVLTKLEISWAKPPLHNVPPRDYTAVIYFLIKRNGQASRAEIETSSGIPTLDRSAVDAVYAASPFPPLPNQWTEPDLAFRIRFTHTPN